ncbi:uncharacterized protein LOC128558274 [Mercenaria mercenaria]|uniref:uncharacterized protein LOC128558274 n=1 Tax=Mercenaria mercenaria TaxID=6596 RepID=UPI00234ED632|nr:uncharacterized protein LOC128558274 [Mercenaria mercenaria]
MAWIGFGYNKTSIQYMATDYAESLGKGRKVSECSHISIILTDWDKQLNIILFVLPPHSSHFTQTLDVAISGPFKKMYSQECQKYMKLNPGINITKYSIAELTSKPYLKALTPENLISAFRRTGIFPFNNFVISDSQVAPSTIYTD